MDLFSKFNFVTYICIIMPVSCILALKVGSHVDFIDNKVVVG